MDLIFHIDHVIYVCDDLECCPENEGRVISDEDIDFILNKLIDACEERKVVTAGSIHPAGNQEKTFCESCEKHYRIDEDNKICCESGSCNCK